MSYEDIIIAMIKLIPTTTKRKMYAWLSDKHPVLIEEAKMKIEEESGQVSSTNYD